MATAPSTNTTTPVEKTEVTVALSPGAAQVIDVDCTINIHPGKSQGPSDGVHIATESDACLDDDLPCPGVTDDASSDEEACSVVEGGCNSDAEAEPPDLPDGPTVPQIGIFQERERGEEAITDALPGSFEEEELVHQIIGEIHKSGLQPRGGSTKQVATASNGSDPMRPKK